MFRKTNHGHGVKSYIEDTDPSMGGGFHIRLHYPDWILYRNSDDSVAAVCSSRDDVADAWARHAKMPLCSICRCVHGDEIQHECE